MTQVVVFTVDIWQQVQVVSLWLDEVGSRLFAIVAGGELTLTRLITDYLSPAALNIV